MNRIIFKFLKKPSRIFFLVFLLYIWTLFIIAPKLILDNYDILNGSSDFYVFYLLIAPAILIFLVGITLGYFFWVGTVLGIISWICVFF